MSGGTYSRLTEVHRLLDQARHKLEVAINAADESICLELIGACPKLDEVVAAVISGKMTAKENLAEAAS